jgi:hypothetical protein
MEYNKLELVCIESNGQIQWGILHAISCRSFALSFSASELFTLMKKPILPAAFSILYEATFDHSVFPTTVTGQLQQ